jgi:hypothetical protein
VTDDFGWEAVTMMRIKDAFHSATVPHPNIKRHLSPLT